MQITVKSESGEQKSWTIPKALLSHHSGYFMRLRNFKEGEEGAVVLQDFDPDVFGFFVEFIYYGRYSYEDDLDDRNRIRDSTKAWVIGDYLDATEFKNFAIRNLYEIYFPPGSTKPRVGVGANAIDYVCKHSTVGSPLYTLHLDFAITWFHLPGFFDYSWENRPKWNELWDEHPAFRNELLYYLNQMEHKRAGYKKSLVEYMEKLTVTDEPTIPS
jgi:hypothetical protein